MNAAARACKHPPRQLMLMIHALAAAVLITLPAHAQTASASSSASTPPANTDSATPGGPVSPGGPIAIVPLRDTAPGMGATVAGALKVTSGKAIIASSGTITSGAEATDVVLPYRGTLRVCASTSVKLAADTGVPAGEVPGLMMALDHGAVEASFATGRNADILLTPDFRILIGGPGAADVKVRLGSQGDTCVDNAGINAPYVLVTSVFDGSHFRVQPGQRVMFQHGSTHEVVDNEKEPCGCPPLPHSGTNEFPLAQSAGLAPLTTPAPVEHPAGKPQVSEPLVYNSPAPAVATVTQQPVAAASPAPVAVAPIVKGSEKRSFFGRIGHFFRRMFGGR